jgi:hypothetical protein
MLSNRPSYLPSRPFYRPLPSPGWRPF